MPTLAELAGAYQNYYTHTADSGSPSMIRRLYRQILNATPIGRERRRLALMCLDKTTPGKLLDIGCGNGQRLAAFRDCGWDVEGQEIDPQAVAIAREHFHLCIHTDPVEKLCGNYDAVVMNHVIEHVPDPLRTLQECHRLLRAGGHLTVVTPNLASYGHRKFGANWRDLDPPRHLHLFTPATLHRLATLAGFTSPNIWTSSARTVGMALESGRSSRLGAVWFQIVAFSRTWASHTTGEECVLQAVK